MRANMRRLVRRDRDDRGAAIVEFAIALPVLFALLLLVFDAGLGYSEARGSSSAARSAARVGALAGDAQDADVRVLQSLSAFFKEPTSSLDDGGLRKVIVYRSPQSNVSGLPPEDCFEGSVPGECNAYEANQIFSLNESQFFTTTLADGTVTCHPDSLDAAWCPLDRRQDQDDFLGVYVYSVYDTTTGLQNPLFDLKQRSVFAMYFPPLPEDVVAAP